MRFHRTALVSLGFALTGAVATAQDGSLRDICGDCRVERFADCGGFLEGATVDRGGTLWVVDLLSGNVISVDDDGECTVEGNTGGQPNGAKFHRDGRLFVADKQLGILAFDPETGEQELIANSHRAERLRGVNDLVFDADGGLYFTEPYGSGALHPNGRVFYMPPGGDAPLEVMSDALAFPNGVALSPDGTAVYVGEYARKRVVSIPSMNRADPFATTYVYGRTQGGIGPDGMALDEAGNLYAAIFEGGGIAVFDASGFPLGRIELPDDAGTFVTNLAFEEDRLYITEASEGVVWRVRTRNAGLPLFHQR